MIRPKRNDGAGLAAWKAGLIPSSQPTGITAADERGGLDHLTRSEPETAAQIRRDMDEGRMEVQVRDPKTGEVLATMPFAAYEKPQS
jgi:hypothetical protein